MLLSPLSMGHILHFIDSSDIYRIQQGQAAWKDPEASLMKLHFSVSPVTRAFHHLPQFSNVMTFVWHDFVGHDLL